jgi:uncharacterized protein (TIGR03437 family)
MVPSRWWLSAFGLSAFLPALLWAQPQRREAERSVVVNLTEIAQKRERLIQLNLLEPAPARPLKSGSPFGQREKPRPQLHAEPAAVGFSTAAADLPHRIAPDTPRTLSGFAGLDDDLSTIPPDTMGAVGPQHVMVTLNSEILVQTRDGRPLKRLVLEDFLRPAGAVDAAFDPRLYFDPTLNRWILCAAADGLTARSALFVGVSRSSDPTGDWNLFRIPSEGSNQWIDYPILGIAGPWVIVTTNQFQLTTNRYVRSNLLVFSKDDLVNGRGAYRLFTDAIFSALPVNDPRGELGRAVLATAFEGNQSGAGVLTLSEIRGEPGAEEYRSAVQSIRIDQPWAIRGVGGDFAPQLNSLAKIDAGDDRMQSCMVRNRSIWCAQTVFLPVNAPNRSAIQWFRIVATQTGYSIAERGRLDDPTARAFYAYPSIAVNRNNDVLIGYSRFSANQFASANFAFRAGNDASGEFQADTVFKPGEAVFRRGVNSNRWGDYSAAVVDPVDDLTLWTLQEFAASPARNGANRYGTWWARITPRSTACTFQVTPSTVVVAPGGGNVRVQVGTQPGCAWMAAPDAGFITVTGSPGEGPGEVSLEVPSHAGVNPRRAVIAIGGQSVALTQEPARNAAELVVQYFNAPNSAVIGQPFSISTRVINSGNAPTGPFSIGFYLSRRTIVTSDDIYTGFACPVTAGLQPGQATTCAGELRIPASVAPGSYQFAVIADHRNEADIPNRAVGTRVSDAGPLVVSAPLNAPRFRLEGIVHGATGLAGPIAPGLITVVQGERLGPAELVEAVATGGLLPLSLAGTEVRVNGLPAPLLSVSADQVSFAAPNTIAGLARVPVQVIREGAPSEVVQVSVVEARPGVFPAGVRNQDGALNAPDSAAARGSVIQVYATGFGVLGADGQIAVSAEIGGIAARVLYAGAAPGQVNGIVQVNVEIPAGARSGGSELKLTVSSRFAAESPVTVYVD